MWRKIGHLGKIGKSIGLTLKTISNSFLSEEEEGEQFLFLTEEEDGEQFIIQFEEEI